MFTGKKYLSSLYFFLTPTNPNTTLYGTPQFPVDLLKDPLVSPLPKPALLDSTLFLYIQLS